MIRTIQSVILTSLLLAGNANAYVNCDGVVTNFQVNAEGTLQVTSEEIWGDDKGRKICSVEGGETGVGTSTCNAWLSIILSAKLSQTIVRVQYPDGVTCSTIPTWESATTPHMIDIR
ncbi:hypothetical protein BTJ40_09835 [Microbulbifer sp. A4B17]|uniref:hypothetical protein n=1 Tax=Microbulbifer sp. A4B17 TaxID=359370 RepID=UPI000D52D914|nr:hypothetical protein [Microbulbifer sp. A4B17]AWF81089.1 hypothetical protein BTJ40_09835 [Microbulbifer sp. A4B17]